MESTILLIARSSSQRIAYAAAFSGYGYNAVEARDFNEARSFLNSGLLPQTIIIDLRQNAAEAEDFMAFLRSRYGAEAIRVIIIGGSWNEAQRTRSRSAIFMHRPVDLGQLLHSV